MMRLIAFLGALSAVAALAQPDVGTILRRVGETYQEGRAYEMTAVGHENGKNIGEIRLHFLFRPPNRYRLEGTGAVMGLAGGGDGLIVYDGAAVWMYLIAAKQYFTLPAAALTQAGDLSDLKPEAIDSFMTSRFRTATELAGEAKLVRQEALNYGGRKVNCYVVATREFTWWVDDEQFRVLREDAKGSSTVFTLVKFGGEGMADGMFKFVPPAGAKRIEPGQ